jgi:hypothetical protein
MNGGATMMKCSYLGILAAAVIAVVFPLLVETATQAAQPSNHGATGGLHTGAPGTGSTNRTIHGPRKVGVRSSQAKRHPVSKSVHRPGGATHLPVHVPIKRPGTKPPVQPVLRRIPGSLGWTCIGAGEMTCTDPRTGKNYLCTNDPSSGEKVCEVGDDTIPGSTNP